MAVTLDGKSFDVELGIPIADLVRRVRAERPGRVVTSIRMNGRELEGDELREALAGSAQKTDDVELQTLSAGAVVAAAMNDAADRLEAAAAHLPSAADNLISGRQPEAFQAVVSMVAAWQVCQQVVVDGAELLGRKPENLPLRGDRLAARLPRHAAKLHEVKEAVETKDAVLLGDLMRYELPDLCDAWASDLRAMATELAAS